MEASDVRLRFIKVITLRFLSVVVVGFRRRTRPAGGRPRAPQSRRARRSELRGEPGRTIDGRADPLAREESAFGDETEERRGNDQNGNPGDENGMLARRRGTNCHRHRPAAARTCSHARRGFAGPDRRRLKGAGKNLQRQQDQQDGGDRAPESHSRLQLEEPSAPVKNCPIFHEIQRRKPQGDDRHLVAVPIPRAIAAAGASGNRDGHRRSGERRRFCRRPCR